MRRIVTSLLVLGLAGLVQAQNINQSVQVTNEYETRFEDFRKSGPELAMPDSLYRFDYRFDYSLFDTPYKGAYEFSPYEIDITPAPMPYDGGKFFLRAGAGYRIHPVLDFTYSAVTKDNFALSIFNRGKGYIGDFIDAEDSFGIGGHYLMDKADLTYQIGYDGVVAGLKESLGQYHSGYARLNIASGLRAVMPYEAGVEYRYGTTQQDLDVKASVAPGISNLFDLRIDVNYRMANRQGGLGMGNLVSATPYFQLRFKHVDVDAGAVVDYSFSPDRKKFGIAPYVRAIFSVGEGGFNFLAGATGGQHMHSGYELVSLNHFVKPFSDSPVASMERLNAYVGFNTVMFKRLQLEIKGGYAVRNNMPMAHVYSINRADYNSIYANLSFAWSSDRLTMDGHFNFNKAFFKDTYYVYEDAPFSGDFRLVYNWNKRIYAGVSVEGASARKDISGIYDAIPWYVSPGLYLEYKFNSHVGIWAKGGNLAAMTIYRFPGFAETNPFGTAGVCLNF